VSALLSAWDRFRDYIANDFLGGPRPLKAAWVINLQKGGTLPFVLFLMWHFDVWTPTAWTYAALHGSYGLAWLLKDRLFPDPNWERRVTFGGAFMMWALVLGLYWIAPVIVVTRRVEQPTWLLGGATIVYVVGVLLMMGSDAQKYFTLRVKRGLITEGFFARVRHPNYLGEMLLYGSFAVVAGHWVPWAVLAWVWLGVFVPNMLRKEASMSRYPEWAAYKARTGFLLPRLVSAASASAPRPSPPPSADEAASRAG
jgi:protein-S-isoprenylcysteine O-methyltransferase Ste14